MAKAPRAVDEQDSTPKPGMGDPSAHDAARDAEVEHPKTLADIEAARGMREGTSQQVEGNIMARTLASPPGARRPGTHQCGNPIGYGYCGGEIDNSDPLGRCTHCGIPSRAARQENAGRTQLLAVGPRRDDDEGPAAQLRDMNAGNTERQIAQLELEGARLALTRQLSRDYWLAKGVDPEGGEFGAIPFIASSPKIKAMQRELDGIIEEAFKRCGLAPMRRVA